MAKGQKPLSLHLKPWQIKHLNFQKCSIICSPFCRFWHLENTKLFYNFCNVRGVQTRTASAGRPRGEFDPKSRLMPEMCHSTFQSWQIQRKPDIMLTMLCPGGTPAVENGMAWFTTLIPYVLHAEAGFDYMHNCGVWEKLWLRAWWNFNFGDVGEMHQH